ncbi:MAG: lysophospholipid acyltransferase family protein [bacterium]|nr:lysophospholipid acyltransferase family protein [bacterium]
MAKTGRGPALQILSVTAVAVLTMLSWLPFGALTRVGAGLGELFFHLDRRRKTIGLDNLRLALGDTLSEDERLALLKRVYKNMGRSALEFAGIPRLSVEKLERFVTIEGLEKLKAAKEAGQGIILLAAHFGNWELLAQSLALHGYSGYAVGRRANVPLLHNYIVRCRESHGNRIIVRDGAIRRVLSVLRQGEILGILGDQHGSATQGMMIDFFGHPAPTDGDIARIILKTQATVLPTFIVRHEDETHTLYVGDPLTFNVTGNLEEDVLQVTKTYMQSIEKMVRKHPDQWLWMHRRWLRRNIPTP